MLCVVCFDVVRRKSYIFYLCCVVLWCGVHYCVCVMCMRGVFYKNVHMHINKHSFCVTLEVIKVPKIASSYREKSSYHTHEKRKEREKKSVCVRRESVCVRMCGDVHVHVVVNVSLVGLIPLALERCSLWIAL